jgi:hypothetical protein
MTIQSPSGPGGAKVGVANYLIATGVPTIAVLVLAVGGHSFQPLLCSPDTLVAGSTMFGFVGIFIGALLTGLGLFVICTAIAIRRSKISVLPVYRPIVVTILVMTIIWTGLSLVLWIAGLFAYYCIGSQAIVVHPSSLASAVIYEWSDVSDVRAGCSRRNGDPRFALRMKDGRDLQLGEFTWSRLERHYAEVGAALGAVPYAYDTTEVAHCSPEYRELFSKRPS